MNNDQKLVPVFDLDGTSDPWSSEMRFTSTDYESSLRNLPRKWRKCVDKTLFRCPDAEFCKTDYLTHESIDPSASCLAMPLKDGGGRCATAESALNFWRETEFDPDKLHYKVLDTLRPFGLQPHDTTWSKRFPDCRPDDNFRVAEPDELTPAQLAFLGDFRPIRDRLRNWTSSHNYRELSENAEFNLFEHVSDWRKSEWYDMRPRDAFRLGRLHVLFFLSRHMQRHSLTRGNWTDDAFPEVVRARAVCESRFHDGVKGLIDAMRPLDHQERSWLDWLIKEQENPDEFVGLRYRALLRYVLVTAHLLRDVVLSWRHAKSSFGAAQLGVEEAIHYILQEEALLTRVEENRDEGAPYWLHGIPDLCSIWTVLVDLASSLLPQPLTGEERNAILNVAQNAAAEAFPDLADVLPDWRELLGIRAQAPSENQNSFLRSPAHVEFMVNLREAWIATADTFSEILNRRHEERHESLFARCWKDSHLPLSTTDTENNEEDETSSFPLAMSLAKIFYLRVAQSSMAARSEVWQHLGPDCETRAGALMTRERQSFRSELKSYTEINQGAVLENYLGSVTTQADEEGHHELLLEVLLTRLVEIRKQNILESQTWKVHTTFAEKRPFFQQVMSLTVTPSFYHDFDRLAEAVLKEWPQDNTHTRDRQARIVAFAELVAPFVVVCDLMNLEADDRELLKDSFCALLGHEMEPEPTTFASMWQSAAFRN